MLDTTKPVQLGSWLLARIEPITRKVCTYSNKLEFRFNLVGSAVALILVRRSGIHEDGYTKPVLPVFSSAPLFERHLR